MFTGMLLIAFFPVLLIALKLKRVFVLHTIDAFRSHWPRYTDEAALEKTVNNLLERMTLREKIAQMSGDGGNAVLVKLGIYVLLLKRFPNMYSGLNRSLAIPPLSFTDGPRGIVIGNATCFPVAMLRGASWDTALERRVGEAIGIEAQATGANYFAGLCVNVLRHPAWGRAQETYGEDSHHLGAMGVALMQGVQSQHVMVCAKHFAVNSIENSRFYLDVTVDETALHDVYLSHFKTLVDAGVDSLMSSYNQLNGEYCGHSHTLLHTILREQWGFKGFVSSDWLWGIYDTAAPANAGMDIEMPRAQFYGKRLWQAVRCGKVPEAAINASVQGILTAKLRWLTSLPNTLADKNSIACAAHCVLAREAAEQSMVLLTNNGILPLSARDLNNKTLAVIGELAHQACLGDHGSSRVSPPYTVSILQGIQQLAGELVHTVFCDGSNRDEAVALARTADVVILVAGYHAEDEGENLTSNRKPVANPKVPRGGDRASLTLSGTDEDLIAAVCAANARTIVTVIAGSAVMMHRWQQLPAAIVWAGYPGMEGGNAVARLLLGDVNPSGKLPFTIPADETQLPAFDCWATTAQYSYFHGYSLLDEQRSTPAFAFGFGLSYTTFTLAVSPLVQVIFSAKDVIAVTVTVRNTGQYAGAEVLQCYAGHTHSAHQPAAIKRLCAFEKVWLAAGEEKAVTLHIPVNELARYNVDTKNMIVESGEYRLWVGVSSRSDDLQLFTFHVSR